MEAGDLPWCGPVPLGSQTCLWDGKHAHLVLVSYRLGTREHCTCSACYATLVLKTTVKITKIFRFTWLGGPSTPSPKHTGALRLIPTLPVLKVMLRKISAPKTGFTVAFQSCAVVFVAHSNERSCCFLSADSPRRCRQESDCRTRSPVFADFPNKNSFFDPKYCLNT